MNFFPILIKSL